jgi:hypothetical protein
MSQVVDTECAQLANKLALHRKPLEAYFWDNFKRQNIVHVSSYDLLVRAFMQELLGIRPGNSIHVIKTNFEYMVNGISNILDHPVLGPLYPGVNNVAATTKMGYQPIDEARKPVILILLYHAFKTAIPRATYEISMAEHTRPHTNISNILSGHPLHTIVITKQQLFIMALIDCYYKGTTPKNFLREAKATYKLFDDRQYSPHRISDMLTCMLIGLGCGVESVPSEYKAQLVGYLRFTIGLPSTFNEIEDFIPLYFRASGVRISLPILATLVATPLYKMLLCALTHSITVDQILDKKFDLRNLPPKFMKEATEAVLMKQFCEDKSYTSYVHPYAGMSPKTWVLGNVLFQLTRSDIKLHDLIGLELHHNNKYFAEHLSIVVAKP